MKLSAAVEEKSRLVMIVSLHQHHYIAASCKRL